MDLDAIEQRTRAATEGPWEYDGRTLWGRDDIGRIKADTPEDRAFTTAARTDVPALVARVRELEDTLRALRALHTKVDGGVFVDKCSCKGSWPCPTAELLEEA